MRNEDIVWVKKGHVQLTMTHKDVTDLAVMLDRLYEQVANMTPNQQELYSLIFEMSQTISLGKVK